MKAMVPDGCGSVELGEVDEPAPVAHELVVAVEAYSINRGETFLLEAPCPHWRPGKDVAGTVVRAAADGTGPTVGQRVVGHPERAGWAERATAPVANVAVLPDDVPVGMAAALPLAGLTALRLLRVTGSLSSRRVLLTGASGGVGHYFVELAAAQGALITAFVAERDRGARLLDLGADQVVPDLSEAAGPYDVVIDSVGGEVFSEAWALLAQRGLFVWMGQASKQPPTIDFFDWAGGADATLRKFLYSDSELTFGEDLATLVRLVGRERLHPEIDCVRHWSETDKAIDALRGRQIRGNVVLEVA